MIRKAAILIFLFTISISSSFASTLKKEYALPVVKDSLLNFVLKDRSSTESYQYIKDISISALSFLKTQGEVSGEKLDYLVEIVSIKLQKDEIQLEKRDIVEVIIKAINS